MIEKLKQIAVNAAKGSYAPYSKCCVGAALLCKNGEVFSGCNIENASFSLTNCAERTVFFKAISSGQKDFSEILIVTLKDGEILENSFAPCGACRQVMREFCSDNFKIHILSKNSLKTFTLGELLPQSFSPVNF